MNLDSVVAVFRSQDEARQARREVQAAEVPHQVPENNWMLTEELVSVDDLDREHPVLVPSVVSRWMTHEKC